jgi:hypothetical protein
MKPIPVGWTAESNYEKYCYIQDRFRHLITVGQTGTGKSTLLENIGRFGIREGVGGTVVDPHGPLVDALLDSVPASMRNKIIVFDPTNEKADWDLGLNFFDNPVNKAHRVEALVTLFRKLYGNELFGPASAQLLRNTCMALYEQEEIPTLLEVQLFLLDKGYRAACLEKVKDKRTLAFFHKYDYQWSQQLREDRTAPLLNKLEPFLSDPILLRVFCQRKSSITMRTIMDNCYWLLVKVSSGKLGEDASALLGNCIVNLLFEAAISRQKVMDTPAYKKATYEERDRMLPLHMFITDEFQNFTQATSIRQILAEARKYKTCAYLGTQSLEIMSRTDNIIIDGQTATKIYFRVGWEDAEAFRKESATNQETRIFQDVETHYAYIRTPHKDSKGVERPTGPHKIRLFPPQPRLGDEVPRDDLIAHSLERHGTPRVEVDAKLEKFLQGSYQSVQASV